MIAPITPEQEEADAIMRVGASPDGQLIRRYLRRRLESCRVTDDAGALQRHEGSRILAREIMVLMDSGLQTDAGSDSRQPDESILRGSRPNTAPSRREFRRQYFHNLGADPAADEA